jgi:hypothetical protein
LTATATATIEGQEAAAQTATTEGQEAAAPTYASAELPLKRRKLPRESMRRPSAPSNEP